MAETEVLQLAKPRRFTKLRTKLGQAQNFIMGLLLIYFFFFGFIANCGTADAQNNPQNYAPDNILFVYTSLFNFHDFLRPWGITIPQFLTFMFRIPCAASLIIFILIGIYQSYKEDFVVYGIKNNIWMVPFIILISWIWTAINARELILATIGRYFSSYHGYLNIIVLVLIYGASGVVGAWFKTLAQKREAMMKSRAFEVLEEQAQQEANEMENSEDTI